MKLKINNLTKEIENYKSLSNKELQNLEENELKIKNS